MRALLVSLIVGLSALSSGCTFLLLRDAEYKEKILNWQITKDEQRVVVYGERYAYIFDLPEQVKLALRSSYRSHLTLAFKISFVDRKDEATGEYFLSLNLEASEEEKVQALSHGFKPTGGWAAGASGDLKGKRTADTSGLSDPALEANHEQQLRTDRIRNERHWADKAWRYALVPVAVIADSVVFAIFVVGSWIQCAANTNCH